jgi:hypothetical protein
MKAKGEALGPLLAACLAIGITAAEPIRQTDRRPDTLLKQTGTITGGFKLSLTVDRQRFVSSEAIMLKVSLSNTTNEPLHMLSEEAIRTAYAASFRPQLFSGKPTPYSGILDIRFTDDKREASCSYD